MVLCSEQNAVTVLRWVARVLGTALVLLIAAFAVGEGVPNPLHSSLAVSLCHVGMFAMLAGQIVAWRWEGVGGSLIIGSFVLFSVANHGMPLNIVFAPWLATGLFYHLCWWRTRRAKGP
jgi:hypothetical protein